MGLQKDNEMWIEHLTKLAQKAIPRLRTHQRQIEDEPRETTHIQGLASEENESIDRDDTAIHMEPQMADPTVEDEKDHSGSDPVAAVAAPTHAQGAAHDDHENQMESPMADSESEAPAVDFADNASRKFHDYLMNMRLREAETLSKDPSKDTNPELRRRRRSLQGYRRTRSHVF